MNKEQYKLEYRASLVMLFNLISKIYMQGALYKWSEVEQMLEIAIKHLNMMRKCATFFKNTEENKTE